MSEIKSGSHRKPPKSKLVVALICLVLGLIGMILICFFYSLAHQFIYSYAVIIDAGSTSSKIYLYRWLDFPGRINGEVTEVTKCRTSPGISSFVDEPSEALVGINYCFENRIIPNIPKRQLKRTFVYLGATAGMRLLKESNPKAIEKIFNVIGDFILTTPMKTYKNYSEIKIISGENEGISAWITANYLQKTIQNSKISTHGPRETFGALDLGGASTQITFVPPPLNEKNIDKRDTSKIHNIRLYGSDYKVYSHSYLCYGKSQAEYRFLALLIKDSIWNEVKNREYRRIFTPVSNPCLLKGDEFNYNIQEILIVPCSAGDYSQRHYGYRLDLPNHLKDKETIVKFVGTGNNSQCELYVNKLFDKSQCNYESCLFNNIYRPQLAKKFLAFSGFFLINWKLKGGRRNVKLTYDQFIQNTREYCAKNAPNPQEQKHNREMSEKREMWRKWECFDFYYVFGLLNGYGFDRDNWDKIEFISEINDASLGWSLGYMIDKSSLIPIEKPLYNFKTTVFVILLLFFLFVILFTIFLFIFYIFRYLTSSRTTTSTTTTKNVNQNDVEEQNVENIALTSDFKEKSNSKIDSC